MHAVCSGTLSAPQTSTPAMSDRHLCVSAHLTSFILRAQVPALAQGQPPSDDVNVAMINVNIAGRHWQAAATRWSESLLACPRLRHIKSMYRTRSKCASAPRLGLCSADTLTLKSCTRLCGGEFPLACLRTRGIKRAAHTHVAISRGSSRYDWQRVVHRACNPV